MISAWTKHLKDPDDQARFTNSLLGFKHIFDRMRELLKEEENNLDHIDRSTKTFDNPNWAYRQAYYNGFRSCLGMLYKLIDLDRKDNK